MRPPSRQSARSPATQSLSRSQRCAFAIHCRPCLALLLLPVLGGLLRCLPTTCSLASHSAKPACTALSSCPQAGVSRHEELLLKFRFTEALEAALGTHRWEVRRRAGCVQSHRPAQFEQPRLLLLPLSLPLVVMLRSSMLAC